MRVTLLLCQVINTTSLLRIYIFRYALMPSSIYIYIEKNFICVYVLETFTNAIQWKIIQRLYTLNYSHELMMVVFTSTCYFTFVVCADCRKNASCMANKSGSFQCMCNEGFYSSGQNCSFTKGIEFQWRLN